MKPMKPNRSPYGTFIISIDDGFVEWSYAYKLPSTHSIDSVERRIRRALRPKATAPTPRPRHPLKNTY